MLRWFLVLAGLAAVLGAMISLAMPLALHFVDRTGVPIACGNGWRSDGENARHEDALNRQHHLLVGAQFVITDYSGQCEQRVVHRRWLAAGATGVGGALILLGLLAPYAVTDRPGRSTATQADPFSSYAES